MLLLLLTSLLVGSTLQQGPTEDSALFLTPLIKQGNISEAKTLSKVGSLNGTNLTSYTGFLTVDEATNSNLFFWFFPSKNETAPLLMWLQGGPGASSLYGLFTENGPFNINDNLELEMREIAWTNEFSMLYIDNPVGAGFSFTDSDSGYARNEDDVARNLYEFLLQFFTLFKEQKQNDFFVSGESYAGKYVPAISYKIHLENLIQEDKINFKGMAIGDGMAEPKTQMGYGDYLYDVGLLDEITRDLFKEEEAKIINFIEQEKYDEGMDIFDALIFGDMTPYHTLFRNVTGLTNHFCYVDSDVPGLKNATYTKYLDRADVRQAIHVGNLTYNDGKQTEIHLRKDILQSVKPWVQAIMENYRVMLYNGQLDVIVAAPLTYNFVNSIDWSGADIYKNSPRQIWKVSPTDDQIAGYVKQSGDFYMVVVRDAGHMVPYYQPRAALDMMHRFVFNTTFSN